MHFTTFSFFLPPSLPFFHPGQIPSSLGLLCSSQFNFIFQWSMVFFTFLFPFNTFAKIEVQLVYNVSGTEQSDSTTHTHTHTHTHTVCVYICVCVCAFLESSILGYYKILNIVPVLCTRPLFSYLTYRSVYLLIQIPNVSLPLLSPLVTVSLFSISVSVSVLWISPFASRFRLCM